MEIRSCESEEPMASGHFSRKRLIAKRALMIKNTIGRPEPTGFEVLIKIHTKDADKILDCPSTVRCLVGEVIDRHQLQEEIDYTLEVTRVYR